MHSEALWDLLGICGIPARTIGSLTGLNSGTECCEVSAGMWQAFVHALIIFNTLVLSGHWPLLCTRVIAQLSWSLIWFLLMLNIVAESLEVPVITK